MGIFQGKKGTLVCHCQTAAARWKSTHGNFCNALSFPPESDWIVLCKIDEKLGPVITVSGIDMLDGTPIYDIKPYLPHIDSHPDAAGGFALSVSKEHLSVVCPDELLHKLPESDRETVLALLAQDPRDRFIQDEGRIWGLTYGNYNIRFQVHDQTLTVLSIE